jgi:hypothetical protein
MINRLKPARVTGYKDNLKFAPGQHRKDTFLYFTTADSKQGAPDSWVFDDKHNYLGKHFRFIG